MRFFRTLLILTHICTGATYAASTRSNLLEIKTAMDPYFRFNDLSDLQKIMHDTVSDKTFSQKKDRLFLDLKDIRFTYGLSDTAITEIITTLFTDPSMHYVQKLIVHDRYMNTECFESLCRGNLYHLGCIEIYHDAPLYNEETFKKTHSRSQHLSHIIALPQNMHVMMHKGRLSGSLYPYLLSDRLRKTGTKKHLIFNETQLNHTILDDLIVLAETDCLSITMNYSIDILPYAHHKALRRNYGKRFSYSYALRQHYLQPSKRASNSQWTRQNTTQFNIWNEDLSHLTQLERTWLRSNHFDLNNHVPARP